MDDSNRRPDSPHERTFAPTEWIEWFGPLRLVTSAVAVVVVCAGAWLLVRSPAPPTEAALPRAATTVPSAPSTSDAAGPPTTPVHEEDSNVGHVLVHVTGAVERPGVYQLPVGARLGEAVQRAGGAVATGRPHELNLALVVVDGMRIEVPVDGQPVDPLLRGDPAPAQPTGALVDVNSAGIEQLQSLPGVGPVTAAAIVAERDTGGPFTTVDDLLRVRGIGPATLEQLRAAVTT